MNALEALFGREEAQAITDHLLRAGVEVVGALQAGVKAARAALARRQGDPDPAALALDDALGRAEQALSLLALLAPRNVGAPPAAEARRGTARPAEATEILERMAAEAARRGDTARQTVLEEVLRALDEASAPAGEEDGAAGSGASRHGPVE
ncbi:MAG: hypothetical protein D6729_09055 [Deltaproteobacteria bacterium]|nr:MAG: hypothetical protein D6729_09055 [Deltaproteobacteria bacterium]